MNACLNACIYNIYIYKYINRKQLFLPFMGTRRESKAISVQTERKPSEAESVARSMYSIAANSISLVFNIYIKYNTHAV